MNFQEAISYTRYGQKMVGMVALKIKSVPDYRLISERDEEAVARVKQIFTSIINEFAYFKADNSLSMEIVWSCSPAINQPFLSYIDISLVFRSVENTPDSCFAVLQKVCADVVTGLNGLKIVSEYAPASEYAAVVSQVSRGQMIALRRPDDVIGFDLAMYPYCFKYDPISPTENDLDPLVNTLINERNSAVVIQLIATRFSDAERMYVSNNVNALGRISQGVMMQPPMGMYRDPRADLPLRTYKKYFETLNQPMVSMNIFVCGENNSATNMTPKVLSLINDSKAEYIASFEPIDITGAAQQFNNVFVSPWLVNEYLLKCNRNQRLLSLPIAGSIYRIASLYTAAEAAQVFRIPIGTRKVTAGVTIHEVEKRNKKFTEGIINVSDISIGKLQNVIGLEESFVGVNLKDLTRHMLVVGTPGSGKSTFLVGLMDRLWKQHKIPFLVIEPAKNEYRSLIESIPDLQVFSPGKNNIAPYIMNPFVPPKGVTIEKYKSIVKAAFSAAFEMWTPLDQLFDETLNICYSEQGWLDSTVVEDASECFSLIDFIRVYKEVVGSKGYSGEYKKQVEAAGVLRLNGLLEQNVNIFDSRYSVPVEDILSRPTVIELSNIKDIKQKSFIIALLLNNIYAYVEANNVNDGKLKNVILLEEAHALLCGDMAASSSEGGPSSNAAAVKLLTDMLAEIRSRGVGIVVADQSPKKVTSQVIANTNVKVMFRLVEADDKDIVRRSTIMNDIQQERLSKLRCGQALLFFDKLDEVEEIVMDDYRLNNSISIDLSDESVKERMVYWDTRGHLLKPYADCDHIQACSGKCDISTRESARVVADRIFRKYYPRQFKDFQGFAAFYKTINTVIRDEATEVFKDPTIADKIGCCVKVHLLRKIHYYTEIPVGYEMRRKTYANMKQN